MVLSASVVLILMLCLNSVISQMSLFECRVTTWSLNFTVTYVDIDYSNQSCQITQFEDEAGYKIALIACATTSKVNLRALASYLGLYFMECSAGFPLDMHLDTEKQWDSGVIFRKTGEKFSVTLTSMFYDISLLSGNFKFFSAHYPNLSITIEFSITSDRQVPQNEEKGILVERETESSAPKIECRVPAITYARGREAMTVGSNPTQTQLLMKCLLPQSFYCLEEVYMGIGYRDAAPDTRKHGILLCSYNEYETTMHYFSPVNSCDVLDISSIWDDENVVRIQPDDSKAVFIVPRLHHTKQVFKDTVTFYENDFLSLQCHYVRYAVADGPVTWVLMYENNTEHTLYGSVEIKEEKHCRNDNGTIFNSQIKESSSQVRIKGRAGMVAIECRANYWNFNKTARAVLNVTIKGLSEAKAPMFAQEETTLETTVDSSLSLECAADVADPEPEYSWKFVPSTPATSNGSSSFILPEHQETAFLNGTRVSTLKLQQFVPSMEGKYTCTALNVRGSAKRIFNITLHKGTTTSIWGYIGIAVGTAALVGITAVWFSRKYFLKKRQLTAMEIKLFEEGDTKQLRSDQYAHENSQFMPYDKGFEVKWSDFKIFDEEKLGQGEFGIVFKGCLVRNPSHTIAVKTTKAGADRNAILALLSELKVMIHLESHESVVKLVGACTEFLKEGRLYIMVEYCPAGSMDSYLRRLDKKLFAEMHLTHSHTHAIQESNLNYEAVDFLATTDMIGWAIQIARGMDHLETKKVIHGDLATRNVLLHSKSRVVITDFGLSRQLLNYENYVNKSQKKLPWRWLALETLKSREFSHKSDVWAYGVTLWEIFTLGLVPYPGMNWTTEFVLYLEDNLRLYQPKFATDNLYKIMMQCWDADPDNRPSFRQLEEALGSLPR